MVFALVLVVVAVVAIVVVVVSNFIDLQLT